MMASLIVLASTVQVLCARAGLNKDPLWKPNVKWCPPKISMVDYICLKTICENSVQPLGCFSQGPQTPWCHMAYAPEPLAKVQPIFWLYKPGGQTPIRLDFTSRLDLGAFGELDSNL